MNVKDPGSQLLRWSIQLEEFDYEITYKRGSQNKNADVLSRIGSVTAETKGSIKLNEETKNKFCMNYMMHQ